MKVDFTVLSLVVGSFLLPGCAGGKYGPRNLPDSYSSPPIEGRIIDKVTGQPVGNVLVIATWYSEHRSLTSYHQGMESSVFEANSTITNDDGSYRVPEWGPTSRGGYWMSEQSDPVVCLYKPGYEGKCYSNRVGAELSSFSRPFNSPSDSVRDFQFNGQDLAIYPLSAGIEGTDDYESAKTYVPTVDGVEKQSLRNVKSRIERIYKDSIDDNSKRNMETAIKYIDGVFETMDELHPIYRIWRLEE